MGAGAAAGGVVGAGLESVHGESDEGSEHADENTHGSESLSEQGDSDDHGRQMPTPVKQSPTLIFDCLRLASKLRDLKDLSHVVKLSLKIMLPPEEAQHHISRIDSGSVRLPSRFTLARQRQKMDVASMHYEREVTRRHLVVRFLSADSSPQLGYNFFGVREDRLVLPRTAFGASGQTDWDQWVSAVAGLTRASIQRSWSTHLWPLTSLGYGAAGLCHKLRNLTHAGMVQCGAQQPWAAHRWSVLGGCSDQGTESKLWDAAFSREPTYEHLDDVLTRWNDGQLAASSDAVNACHLFPQGLFLPEHLHILSNALENSIHRSACWMRFEKGLKHVAMVFNTVQYRQRFAQCCLRHAPGHVRKALGSFRRRPLDWRWEYLSEFLDRCVPVLGLLKEYFDADKIRNGSDGDETSLGVVENEVFESVAAFLKLDILEPYAEMIRVFATATKQEMQWLEGCDCHPPKTSRGRSGTQAGGFFQTGRLAYGVVGEAARWRWAGMRRWWTTLQGLLPIT